MEDHSTLRHAGFKNFIPSYWHEPTDQPLLAINMSQVIARAAELWGEDEAFVSRYENVRLTFTECKGKADKIASGLLELGLKPGDTIALWGSVSSHLYLTVLAAARAGLILAGIESTGNTLLIIHALKKVKAKAFIVIEVKNDKNYFEMLHKAILELSTSEPGNLCSEQFPKLKIVVTGGNASLCGTFNLEYVFERATSSSMEYIQELQDTIQPDDRFIIFFTSGSTGKSKAVPLSHHQLINSTYQFEKAWKIYKRRSRILAKHPVYERSAMERFILPAFLFGCTTVFANVDFNIKDNIDVLQSERCSILHCSPSFCLDMMLNVKEHNIKLNYPEVAIVGGAPLTEKIAAGILNTFTLKGIIVSYGMTEGGGFGYNLVTNDLNNVSLFQTAKNFEVKIVDTNEKIVPIGQKGELCVRGNSVMKKYLNEREKTAECITSDGWLKTGDSCILQENGLIRLVGRIKEMVLRDNENIFPKEIENFLNTHPSVTEVHAFGVPDRRLNEELCVYIRKSNGKNLTEKEVKNYCIGKLDDFKIPRYVRFVDEFPRDATGKVNKRILMELFKNDDEYIQQNLDVI